MMKIDSSRQTWTKETKKRTDISLFELLVGANKDQNMILKENIFDFWKEHIEELRLLTFLELFLFFRFCRGFKMK